MHAIARLAVALLMPLLAVAASSPPVPAAYDLVLAGGRVVDGTGAPWRRADVGVVGDRIAAVGDLAGAAAKRRIDASRLVVAPGFIDMLGQSEYHVLVDNRAASKITQGITTEVTGEGGSIAPLDERMIADGRETWERYGVVPDWTTLAGYWRAFERARPAINLATFVGAGGVRDLVVGKENRPATPAELRAMEAAVAQAMEEGALGLSSSLIYIPDRFASTEELIALAKVAARYGGSYITHQRDEGDGIDASLDEAFRIAREASIPTEIYHLKTAGRKNWGRMPAVLARLEAARASGLDVIADQYPWAASSNGLDASLPAWVREGGRARLVERLRDPELRERARRDFLAENPADWSTGGAGRILITSVLNPELRKYEGKTLAEIGAAEGKDPLDVLIDLVIADRGNTGRVTFSMHEDDVRAALRHPLVSMCTDSGARAEDGVYAEDRSHPRAWATAPRILGHYVREEKLLALEEAIRKMTSLPAARMGLHDRGIVRPGMAADLVAFDPETIAERSTYADPNHYSAGVEYVAVNGELVVDGGQITAARPGRPLYGPGYRRKPPLSGATIDHLVLGVSDLAVGVAEFRERTGVEPVFGGRHPQGGTQNALAALGAGTYVEIIAPVPGAELSPMFAGLTGLAHLTPLAWAVGVADATAAVADLRALGLATVGPLEGSRLRPDGRVLAWRIVFIESQKSPLPFFIQWQADSPHPSTTSPAGCALAALKLRDPEPEVLKRVGERFGLALDVERAAAPGLAFSLRCPKGVAEFASP